MSIRRTIRQVRHRSRLGRVGRATGPGGLGAPGQAILSPRDFGQAPSPGSFQQTTPVLAAHTHAHDALNGLTDDDHGQYLLIPRTKWRVVAPTGAPYTSPRTAIQACAAGEGVFILGGTYVETETITLLADDIVVLGVGRESVLINNTHGAGARNIFDINGHDGIVLAHFGIQTAAGNTGRIVNDALGGDDLWAHDLRIIATAMADIFRPFGGGGQRQSITRCYVTGAPTGYLLLGDGADMVIADNTFDVTSNCFGISPRGDRGTIIRNVIRSTVAGWSRAILNPYNQSFSYIAGNRVVVAGTAAAGIYGVRYSNAAGGARIACIFAHNVFEGQGDVGRAIEVGGGAGTLDDVLITDNICRNWNIGIRVNDAAASWTVVHDNNVHTCTTPTSDAGTNTSRTDNV